MAVDSLSLSQLAAIIVPTVVTVSGVAAKSVMWAAKRELNGSAQRIRDIDAKLDVLQANHVAAAGALEFAKQERHFLAVRAGAIEGKVDILRQDHGAILDRVIRVETIVDERT